MKKTKAKMILDKILINFIEEINIINYYTHLSHSNFKKYHTQFLSNMPPEAETKMELPFSGANVFIMDPFDNHKSVSFGGVHVSGKEYGERLVENLNNNNRLLIVLSYEAFERYYLDLYAALGYLDKNLWNCADFGDVKMRDLTHKKINWFHNKVTNSKTGKKIPIRKILNSMRNNFNLFDKIERKGNTYLRMWTVYIQKLRHAIVHNQSILPLDIYDDVLKEAGYPRSGHSALEKKGMMERFLEYKNNHYEILAIKSRDVKPPYHFLSEPTKAIINKLCMHTYIAYTATIKHFGQSSIFNTN